MQMEDYPTPRALRKDEIPGIIDAFRWGCHPLQCTWVEPLMSSAVATAVGLTACMRLLMLPPRVVSVLQEGRPQRAAGWL